VFIVVLRGFQQQLSDVWLVLFVDKSWRLICSGCRGLRCVKGRRVDGVKGRYCTGAELLWTDVSCLPTDKQSTCCCRRLSAESCVDDKGHHW